MNCMNKVHAKTIREVINHVGLKDRHAQKLVIDSIYSAAWGQEVRYSAIIVPNEDTIENRMKTFLRKRKVDVNAVSFEGLTDEAKVLLKNLK
jgi:hypothetical protein